jgi:hypothetical protein
MGFLKSATALIVGVCLGHLVSQWRDRVVRRQLQQSTSNNWRYIFRGGTRL